MSTYASGSLYLLPYILVSEANPGLHGGTLYNVLDTASLAPGTTTVDATGFNVTCGFSAVPTPPTFSVFDNAYLLVIPAGNRTKPGMISSTQSGMISTAVLDDYGVVFYSTIPIIDSDSEKGGLVALSPPMNTSVSSIQVIRCSLSLVSQVAVLDSQTLAIHTVEPGFTKTASKWMPYTEPEKSDGWRFPNVTGNVLIDLWEVWYKAVPPSNYYLDYTSPNVGTASVADIYLIQKLNLPAANHSNTQNITLHDLENALSTLVASMFWTCHVHSPYNNLEESDGFANGTAMQSLNDVPTPPILLPGNATITEVLAETQLELSIIAVSAGLVVSIVLMAVSLPLLRQSKFDEDLPIDGTGILHVIWLYRNHPELERMLEQVEHPTDENLRAAGMVRMRLVCKRDKDNMHEVFYVSDGYRDAAESSFELSDLLFIRSRLSNNLPLRDALVPGKNEERPTQGEARGDETRFIDISGIADEGGIRTWTVVVFCMADTGCP
ncbi:hypothetical protein B0H12DRAFT_1081476 [Mycena haematopus]|nr:hypothetical protein B0H12DRAFT_1081476 [Mycena haematopus]